MAITQTDVADRATDVDGVGTSGERCSTDRDALIGETVPMPLSVIESAP